MKKTFILLCGLIPIYAFAQQSSSVTIPHIGQKILNVSSVTTSSVTTTAASAIAPATTTTVTATISDTTTTTSKPVRFALIGIGDISSQTLSQVNASGKLSFYAKPYSTYFYKNEKDANGKNIRRKTNKEFIVSTFASFNANAKNSDTLLEGTILFPDLGNSSFLITPEVGIYVHEPDPIYNEGWSYYYGLLGEFTNKRISGSKKKDGSDTSVYFNVNSITVGLKGAIFYQPDNSTTLSFTGIFYFNYVHIPDKDSNDFRYILTQPKLSTNFNSVGIKMIFGINDFQIYADLRHTYYNPAEVIPDRGLASFNANVGIVIPVTILKFPK